MEKTAEDVLKFLKNEFVKYGIDIELTDKEEAAFKANFVRGMEEGRDRILSKLAPKIG